MAAMPASASLGAAASGGLGYAAADGTVVAERPHFSPLSHAEASVCAVLRRDVQRRLQFPTHLWSMQAPRIALHCYSCLLFYFAM